MGSHIFEVRVKNSGKIFSRHYTANSPEQAANTASKWGRILGVRKVRPMDIIGDLESDNLTSILFESRNKVKEAKTEFESMTLEGIVFGNQKQKRAERRGYKINKDKKEV
jgi:hypothetical protein